MLPLKFPWAWMSLGIALVVGVCVGSLLPAPYIAPVMLSDKLVHAAAYCVLMVWFSGMYGQGRHWMIALLLFVLGFSLDFAQAGLSTRSFELSDVAANASGILLGLILARFIFAGWCRRIEQWVFP